jgi:anaerobic selenocysteine-containing dehydrogenase
VRVEKEWANDPLRVASLIATRNGDLERGPLVIMNAADASARLLNEGELAWVYGPRRHELAPVRVDADIRRGEVILRDINGASPSEVVRVVKPELDTRGRRPTALA